MDPYSIVKYPVSTEKSLRLIEAENKLVFVVDLKARKAEIRSAVENMFNVKVEKVNTMITRDGKKYAYVKLVQSAKALEVATNLGIGI